MEALSRLAARRPVAVAVFAAAMSILGWIAWGDMPLDLLPDIQSPTIVVSTRSGDRPPVEMERIYGERVEQLLFTVRGIRSVEQVARTGRLIATVTFEWDTDMDLALVDVEKSVGVLRSDPDVEEVLVRRLDPRQAPVLSLGLIAPDGRPDLAELRRVARRQVAPALERLDGVAEARVLGGREREIQDGVAAMSTATRRTVLSGAFATMGLGAFNQAGAAVQPIGAPVSGKEDLKITSSRHSR